MRGTGATRLACYQASYCSDLLCGLPLEREYLQESPQALDGDNLSTDERRTLSASTTDNRKVPEQWG